MNKKKIFKWLAISAGVLSLAAVLLVGNTNLAFSSSDTSSNLEIEKIVKASELEIEKDVRDSAIKTFNIDTNKFKPVLKSDLEEKSTSVTPAIKTKVTAAYVMFSRDGILKNGDYIPTRFVGGNEVLIAIKHADGTMSLVKYDVSQDVAKQKPIKADHVTKKEVK